MREDTDGGSTMSDTGEYNDGAVYQNVAAVTEGEAGVADNEAPPFRFLDLYPELRNAIYEIAIASDKQASKGASGRHAFLSLAQSCQQIRQEFHTVYMTAVPFHVKDAEVCMNLIHDLFPGNFVVGGTTSPIHLNLIITPSRRSDFCMNSRVPPLLLHLVETSPHLSVRFTDYGILGQCLNTLLARTKTGSTGIQQNITLLNGIAGKIKNKCQIAFRIYLDGCIHDHERCTGERPRGHWRIDDTGDPHVEHLARALFSENMERLHKFHWDYELFSGNSHQYSIQWEPSEDSY
ncbi:hypothetical protein NX059_012066 [Plenodomus lindquistii]|nr:hypothetical protein NX059_012066 [Plenodomus lindquistii]